MVYAMTLTLSLSLFPSLPLSFIASFFHLSLLPSCLCFFLPLSLSLFFLSFLFFSSFLSLSLPLLLPFLSKNHYFQPQFL